MKIQKTKTGITLAIVMMHAIGIFAQAQVTIKDKNAENIFKNYVSAIGGEKAIGMIENMVLKSELSFVETGFTVNREMIIDKSNNYYGKATAASMGEVLKGYDGNVCWEIKQSKLRLIVDNEKQTFLNESAFLRYSNWEKNLVAYEYLGQEDIDGTELLKISVTTIYGAKETWYFNKKDNLLARIDEPLVLAQGEIKVITTFEDYRDIDGVKHSFIQHIIMPGRTRKISFSSIMHNQPIDKKIFSVPAEQW